MVKYIASNKLSFPVSDVESSDGDKIILNFMGLTGVDSPLPSYIKFSPLLEKINTKIYTLFFEAIRKLHHAENYCDYVKASFGETRQNLEKELKNTFRGVKIIIAENVPVWIKISDQSKAIGQMTLGDRICVSGFKIDIPRCASPVVIGQWIMR